MILFESVINNALNLTPKGAKTYYFDLGQASIRNQEDVTEDYLCWALPTRITTEENQITGKIKKTYNVTMTITSRYNGVDYIDISDTNSKVKELLNEVFAFAESFTIKLSQDTSIQSVGNTQRSPIYFQDDNMRTGCLLSFSFTTKYINRDYCLDGVLDYWQWGDGDNILWGDGIEIQI